MSKTQWMTISASDLGQDTRTKAEKERDRLEGLQRALAHTNKRKGPKPDYDLMCDRVSAIIDELRVQDELIRLKESEVARLKRELAQKKQRD